MGIKICGSYQPFILLQGLYFNFIDYVIKLVVAKALARATEQAVSYFLFEEFFVYYGIPHEIFIDVGSQFTSNMIQRLTENIIFNVESLHPIIHSKMDRFEALIKFWRPF